MTADEGMKESPLSRWKESRFLAPGTILPILFILAFSMAALNLSARLLGEERDALKSIGRLNASFSDITEAYYAFESALENAVEAGERADFTQARRSFGKLLRELNDLDSFVSNRQKFPQDLTLHIERLKDDLVLIDAFLARIDDPDADRDEILRNVEILKRGIHDLLEKQILGGFMESRRHTQQQRHNQITLSVFIMGLSGFVLIVVLLDKLSKLRRLSAERHENLRMLEQRLIAMSSAFDSMCVTDAEGRITYVNESLLVLYEYEKEDELLGRPWTVLYDGIHCEWLQEEIFPLLEEKPRWDGHTIGQKSDGTSFNQDLSLTRLPGGGYICIIRDVSELMRTEALSKRRLAAIEAAADGIGICDENHRILYLNQALMSIHSLGGYDQWSWRGKHWSDIYDKNTARYFKEDILPELARSGQWRGERKLSGKDGAESWVDISLTVLPEGGFIGTTSDVTGRKNSEKEKADLQEQFYQAQKMEAIGRLAGGIAHDFNNILAAILGYAEFLTEDLKKDPEKKKYAENILAAGAQARQLVEQMLQFSRRKESEKSLVGLSEVLKDTLDILHASFPKTIEIETDIRISSAHIRANQTQLAQVLMNLCVNAKDAMSNDHGRLVISFDEVEADPDLFDEMVVSYETARENLPSIRIDEPEPGQAYLELGHLIKGHSYAVLSVEDTGSGMSKAIMQHIFEPFFTTKSVDEGTGLGLANVHGIVLGHSGALTIESTLGQGTRFDIFLPIETPEKKIHVVASDGDLVSGSGHILVVEDQANVREMLVTSLERLGYECAACNSGVEALEILRQGDRTFDLVVSDHNMPVMTGLELAEQARIEWPDLGFVIVTGYTIEALNRDISEYESIRAVLHKPVDRQQLSVAVKTAISRAA